MCAFAVHYGLNSDIERGPKTCTRTDSVDGLKLVVSLATPYSKRFNRVQQRSCCTRCPLRRCRPTSSQGRTAPATGQGQGASQTDLAPTKGRKSNPLRAIRVDRR